MQEEKIPKIFISYSWKTENFVSDLARRLCADGVDVVWDKWDLKLGHDIYKFMENPVNDSDITKVLLICDKTYKEKADNRTGGVGTETIIISSEIYTNAKQEKFIPLIIEKDEENKPFLPTFINSRFYIDFTDSDKYEESYEQLIRNIYDKPKYSKPKLGKKPDYLDEDKVNYFPLNDLIKQIKGSNNDKKKSYCITKFETDYIETLKKFYTKNTTPQQAYDNFCNMKPIRDIYLDFLELLVSETNDFTDNLCSFFENLYNTLTNIKSFGGDPYCVNLYDFDIFNIHIWELFILTITYLRHIQDYKSINQILTHTYFLDYSSNGNKIEASSFSMFDYRGEIIEALYKPTSDRKNRFSILADDLYKSRLKLPIFTGDNIAESDLFIYQVSQALDKCSWFPSLYVYVKNPPIEWIKIKSKEYCQKYLFPLFGVNSIDELKLLIAKCKIDKDFKYSSDFKVAPTILSYIKFDEIGIFN